jgi:hypothetical protein
MMQLPADALISEPLPRDLVEQLYPWGRLVTYRGRLCWFTKSKDHGGRPLVIPLEAEPQPGGM